jgi:hypothetical protein
LEGDTVQIDGIYHDHVIVCLSPEDIRLLADLCNDLAEDAREFNSAHRETMGAALETAEMFMHYLLGEAGGVKPTIDVAKVGQG